MAALDAYRNLPADEVRGNPLHAWGSIHANKLGTYWTIPVDVPLRNLSGLRPVVQSKTRLASVLTALRSGVELPPIEVAVYRDGSAWIVDGNHRLIATRRLRLSTIPVTFTFVGAPAQTATAGARKKTSTQLKAEVATTLRRRNVRHAVKKVASAAEALRWSETAEQVSDDAYGATDHRAAAKIHHRAAQLHATSLAGAEAAQLHEWAASQHRQAAKARTAEHKVDAARALRKSKTWAAYQEKLSAARDHAAMAHEYARRARTAARGRV